MCLEVPLKNLPLFLETLAIPNCCIDIDCDIKMTFGVNIINHVF
jgi:hypothetical protein